MLGKKYNAKEAEKKWQTFWQEQGIYKFAENADTPIYSIDTPPPTVNGKIHIGHIFSYAQAEMMARYKRMKGFRVFYPFGFDDNGLPTERLVERTHGIKAHQTTREEFAKLCLQETESLEAQFRQLFIAAGFSCDWNHTYSTISPKAQAISQKSFIELYKKKKVYFSKAPALWCTECRTAIAQAELETKEIPSAFHYLKFFIEGSDEYVEIATTRPELLAACQCILINPEDERNKRLLEKRIQVPLFDFSVPVYQDEKVETAKGSGVVMCCTFGDLTDLEWYKKYHLDFKEAILQDGTMSGICGKYAGLRVLDARRAIVADLVSQGYMIKREQINHNVAVHERCGTPMEITIKKQWFIDILSNKQQYLEAGERIHWYPAHMKARYRNWVENLEWDWCISRQRYFGVPFPVWYCKACGEAMVADVEKLPVNPLKDMPDKKCPCGCGEFVPEKDIMDTWATSSVTPLINLNWHDKELFRREMLPMSVRPNAHDIIRTWDFYTIVKSLYHTGDIPWKDVMVSGHVMTAKGEKISKKKANASMEPQDVLEQYSADVVRLWAATGSLGNDIIFSEDEFQNVKKLINKIWNAAKFVIMQLEGFEGKLSPYDGQRPAELLFMDQWIIISYNRMLAHFENYLSKYEIGLALGELEKFFWSYCDDYIEIVKNRVYKPEIYGENARRSGLYACYHTLLGILKCFAIYIPHITEEIYQGYYAEHRPEKSIHISMIEAIANDGLEDKQHENKETVTRSGFEKLYKTGCKVVEVISMIRRHKSENNLSLKAELAKVVINLPENIEFPKDAVTDIKAVCACREVEICKGEEQLVQI